MKPVEQRVKNPIYIYCPVGLGSLDILDDVLGLCLALKDAGYQTWIAPPTLFFGTDDFESINERAPVLNHETLMMHFRAAFPPIVIYPDIVRGNPLNAQVVARWLVTKNDFDQDQYEYQKFEFHFALASSRNEGRRDWLSGREIFTSFDDLGDSLIDFAGSSDYLSPVRSRRKLPLGRIGLAWHVYRTEGFLQLAHAIKRFLITTVMRRK